MKKTKGNGGEQQRSAAATVAASATAAANNEKEALEEVGGGGVRMIDNRGLVYIPVQINLRRRGQKKQGQGGGCCGGGGDNEYDEHDDYYNDHDDYDDDDCMIVFCRPDVVMTANDTKIMDVLQSDIRECLEVLPPSVHGLILRTRLWLNGSFVYGPVHKQRNVKHLTTHHTTEWLEWAYDNVAKVHGIEIYNVQEYLEMRHHWNGCGLLLHEFCHLIHQLVLDLSNPQILLLYQNAKRSHKYHEVLRRDWAGMSKEVDMAYAMVNHKEFFAEMSVTFLCEVKPPACPAEADLETSTKRWLSPPLTSPRTIQRVCKMGIAASSTLQLVHEMKRGRDNDSTRTRRRLATTNGNQNQPLEQPLPRHDRHDVWYVRRENVEQKASSFWCCPSCCERRDERDCCWRFWLRKKRQVDFCNKFFPFTRQQLANHDADLEQAMAMLWRQIQDWQDPFASYNRKDNTRKEYCCSPWWLWLFRSRQEASPSSSSLLLSPYEPVPFDEGPGDTVSL